MWSSFPDFDCRDGHHSAVVVMTRMHVKTSYCILLNITAYTVWHLLLHVITHYIILLDRPLLPIITFSIFNIIITQFYICNYDIIVTSWWPDYYIIITFNILTPSLHYYYPLLHLLLLCITTIPFLLLFHHYYIILTLFLHHSYKREIM